MKITKYLFLSACLMLLISASMSAQNPNLPKRYVTVELFTNTPCPSCVVQNPGFFDVLSNYPNDVHLISFYPGQPYSSCPIYQENVAENEYRTSYRNISGTPRVWVNGDISKRSGQINAADIDRYVEDKSFLSVRVEETGSVMVTATVQIKTFDTPDFPTGRLFVAAVEKDVTLTGIPSGWEEHHFDVFRLFASPQEGLIIDMSIDDQTISFDYLANPDWDLEKVYLLAWVEHPETKEVWNSGTRFDDIASSLNINRHLAMEISPNPATDLMNIELPDNFKLDKIEIMDVVGKSMLISQDSRNIDVANLPAGNYMVVAWSLDSSHIVSQFTKE